MRKMGAEFRVGLVLAGSLVVTGCAAGGGSERPSEEQVVPAVEAVRARSGSLPLVERVSGVVKADNQVSITSEIEARVAEVLVRSGDPVRRGQPLVRLEDDALRDQLRQAEAAVQLEQAAARAARARADELRAGTRRARDLAREQLVAKLELETLEAQLAAAEADADQAAARVEQARATLDERRAAIDKTVVRSPVAGRLGRRNAEVGMLASTGAVLFQVGNLDQLIVEVPLTGEMLDFLVEGLPVRISADTLGREPLQATLSRISPFLAAGSFSTVGEIDVSNRAGQLRPGMFVTVDLLYGESTSATLVPTSAVWEDPVNGEAGVFVADLPAAAADAGPPALSEEAFGIAFRPVEIVADGRETAGVRGVEEGEWVVTVGQHLLQADDASRARVRRAEWDRVMELQGLQREDLLRGFLEKQQRLARTLGAAPPTTDEFGAEGREDSERRPAAVD